MPGCTAPFVIRGDYDDEEYCFLTVPPEYHDKLVALNEVDFGEGGIHEYVDKARFPGIKNLHLCRAICEKRPDWTPVCVEVGKSVQIPVHAIRISLDQRTFAEYAAFSDSSDDE